MLLVALPIAGAVATAFSNRDDGPPKLRRDGSRVVVAVGDTSPLPARDVPTAFELTYLVERYDPNGIVESTEVLTVRRPFDGHIVTLRDGKRSGERVTRLGELTLVTPQGPRSLPVPPAPSGSDLRGDFVFGDVPASVAAPREQREVAGRRCQVYRIGTSLLTGELKPPGSVKGEQADVCFDGSGLLLEEVWWKDGRAIRRKVATKLTERPIPDSRFRFENTETIGFDAGQAFLKEIDPTSSVEGPIWQLPAAPTGFSFVGRYVAQPPDLNVFESPLEAEQQGPSSLVQADVWMRGPDYIILTNTLVTNSKGLPGDPPNERRIELEGVGEARAVYDPRGNYVRADFPDARFVRLTASLPMKELIELSGTLQPTTGTGVVFRD